MVVVLVWVVQVVVFVLGIINTTCSWWGCGRGVSFAVWRVFVFAVYGGCGVFI